ncbi:hypothetical protein L6452_23034 [Arctium lappa]|uniref:Uncharacterized protein n=1 Tax=Arctium lappa TaxID=4217 RepID=A0ACB9B5P4_ARCLA|nr:hypothetical protein L6452_23034 [Arctium lappa]
MITCVINHVGVRLSFLPTRRTLPYLTKTSSNFASLTCESRLLTSKFPIPFLLPTGIAHTTLSSSLVIGERSKRLRSALLPPFFGFE